MQDRYLVVLYHTVSRAAAAAGKVLDLKRREEELAELKLKHGIEEA